VINQLLLATLILTSGYFEPIELNEPSICPQQVRLSPNQRRLRVNYEGDCAGQGPYFYDCFPGGPESAPVQMVCLQGDIEFEVLSPTQYRWKNRTYGFEALFERKGDAPPSPSPRD
jgi:hypothetical protein